jgi:hypothetical protein
MGIDLPQVGCTAIDPGMTQRDQALFLNEKMPAGLFSGVGVEETRVAWRLSPEPFWLSPQTFEAIESLGPVLLKFYRVLAGLYARSARGTAPAFIAEYLDAGKPDNVVKLGRQNRFKSDVPGVIRPDLILTGDGYIASELDSVPGGMGFVGAMAAAYCQLGYESAGGVDGMLEGLAAMLERTAAKERPTTAVVVSRESDGYRAELTWLADAMRAKGLGRIHVCRPEDIVFTEDALFVRLDDGEEVKLDVLYRNFEIFDLPNVPKQDLMLFAARHNRVKLTPPPKAHLEEKLSFALLHHPALAKLWRAELGGSEYDRLRTIFPQTWVLDPRPLPPQASIMGLNAGDVPLQNWSQLVPLGKSERDFVVKPSGFSELAWGSRGVKVANDLPKEDWQAALDDALASYPKTPYILQRFHKGKRVRVPYFDRKTDDIATLEGRVRLCPYYFVTGETTVRLGGILATIAPADKRLIHGMADAIMSPCAVREDGY